MLTKIPREKSFYEKYFMEADDEEDNVTVKVATRSNRGTDYSDDTTTARVEPRRSTATDYSQEGDDAPEEEEASAEDTPTADGGEDEGTDYSDEGDDTDTAQDDEAGEDTAEDESGEDEATDYSDEGDEGGGEDEATDYSDEGDSEGEGEEGESDSSEDNQESDDSSSDEDPETKQKKFYVYKRYLRLYNLLGIFISKIQGVIKNDVSQNAVLKIVVSNLTRVKDTLYDYMTIKYKTQTYVQVLFFMETAMSVVKLNFELLRNNKINLKQ